MFFPKKTPMNPLQALSAFNLAICGVGIAVHTVDTVLNYCMARKYSKYCEAIENLHNKQTGQKNIKEAN